MGDETAFRVFAERLSSRDDKPGRDEAAQELLVRYSARLVALARRSLSPRLARKADADDVLQSVLRTFFRRLDAGEVELRGWGGLWGFLSLMTLRTCQRNGTRYATAKRDAAREVSLRVADSEQSWELAVPDREPTPEEAAAFADELRVLLAGLDQRDRDVVELLLAGESADAIAKQTHCSRRTVRRTMARVRSQVLSRQGKSS